jgi:VCBS repeat-containing protein
MFNYEIKNDKTGQVLTVTQKNNTTCTITITDLSNNTISIDIPMNDFNIMSRNLNLFMLKHPDKVNF